MTLQNFIDSIAGNLGDRASGTIGGQNSSTVIIRAANLGLSQCVKLANPDAFTGITTIAMASGGAQEYPLPLVNDQKIKDLTGYRFTRDSDDTTLTVTKIPYPSYIEITRSQLQALGGIPSYWSVYNNTIYINRVPTEDLTLNLYVELWPKELTVSNLNEALPIDTEWELAAEAYATYYCFLKLQQTQDALYWRELHNEQKKENTQVDRKKGIRHQGMASFSGGGNRVLDPFNNDTGYRY